MKPSKLSYEKVWKLAFFYFAVVITGLLSLSGCQNKEKPSYIIVALDRLAFNSFSCVDERSTPSSGLAILCKEAIRFTHAYTTSTQPAAALGSLLTGSYPFSHNLHRSSGRIHTEQKLLSEMADAQGYRTSFFSGSPTILKKTGLSKGFDLFDDLTFLERKNYLTSFKKQSEMALSWMSENSDPFFTVIYNSDLESLGEVEPDVSAFEKLDDSLATFFFNLKSKNLWESNYIIVVGLQGVSDYSRTDETLMSNLHSENTNVILFVKPPRQKGDDGISKKVDTSVNIADLGWGLMKTLDESFLKPVDNLFPLIDLSFFWKKTATIETLPNQRKILIESINPWAEDIETRYAILYKNLIYIENQTDELYNSLADGLETIDISSSATSAQNDFKNENRNDLNSLRGKTNQNAWINFKTDVDDWVASNREYWSKPNSRSQLLDQEFLRYKNSNISQPLTALMIQNIMANNKYDILKQLHLKIDLSRSPIEKENYFEEARRQSLNLSLENLWGLWIQNKNWVQSPFIKEYQ